MYPIYLHDLIFVFPLYYVYIFYTFTLAGENLGKSQARLEDSNRPAA